MIKIRGWGAAHRGFEGARNRATIRSSDWLKQFKELPSQYFRRYGSIDQDKLVSVPDTVYVRGNQDIYQGLRILVKRTLDNRPNDNGRIVARLEDVSYCFRNTVHGFSISEATSWEQKILIGILWSSIARYFLFLTSSGWGIYHYEIHLNELMSLPIRFPEKNALRNQIVEVVDKLLSWEQDDLAIQFDPEKSSKLALLERQLNEYIYELYGLSQSECDLVEDMCSIGLELLYRNTSRKAISQVDMILPNRQGTIRDLGVATPGEVSLQNYLHTFLKVWNRELEPAGEFSWKVVRPSNVPMIAVIFTTREKGQLAPREDMNDILSWNAVLQRCAEVLSRVHFKLVRSSGMPE